jgi:hypothetical protein
MQLPTLNLIHFDGKYENWGEFYDSFCAVVYTNNNPNLSDVQRFYYLRTSLEGDAVQVIQLMNASGSNYELALTLYSVE